MKALTLLTITLLATVALCNFVPVPDYNLSQLAGTWNVQSIYDTSGSDWGLAYCFEISFDIINASAVNMSTQYFDASYNQLRTDWNIFYPDSENPAILYQKDTGKDFPLLVANVSSSPYWVDNVTTTTILAMKYTMVSQDFYIVMGISKAYDIIYDISSFVISNNLPAINYTHNYWFINSACDTHFGWTPLKTFKTDTLFKDYNLIGVYDPAGSGLVPWYTGSAIFGWEQAYCAKVSFVNGTETDHRIKMTLSLKSLYEGEFERSWEVASAPQLNAALMGFTIDGPTLLYVQYADALGNLILTAGTTTSFALSTKAPSLTPAYREAFEATLEVMGWKYDANLIYSIDSSSC